MKIFYMECHSFLIMFIWQSYCWKSIYIYVLIYTKYHTILVPIYSNYRGQMKIYVYIVDVQYDVIITILLLLYYLEIVLILFMNKNKKYGK